jgi:hypothetical protein
VSGFQQNVPWFDVTMDDAMRVGVPERISDFARNPRCVCYGKGTVTEEPLAKRFPLDVWHDVIENFAAGGRVVERKNVRVGKAGRDLDFPQEALWAQADSHFGP